MPTDAITPLSKVLAEQGAAGLAAIVFAVMGFVLLGALLKGVQYVLTETVPRTVHEKLCAALDKNTAATNDLVKEVARGGAS